MRKMRVIVGVMLMIGVFGAERPLISSRCIDTFMICLKSSDDCQVALDTFYSCADTNCFSELDPDALPSTHDIYECIINELCIDEMNQLQQNKMFIICQGGLFNKANILYLSAIFSSLFLIFFIF
jgi:hypothetical protein